ncbi:MAG: hypothetical protein ACRDS1_16310, partial [Pseudonocardiaceae bacterium]
MSSGNANVGASDVVSVLLALEPDPELDAEAGQRLTRQLRTELAELDIESVDLAAAGTAPDGAKGADPVKYLWLDFQAFAMIPLRPASP